MVLGEFMAAQVVASFHTDELERNCVLVVEDEIFVRWAVTEALRDEGYQVIEAASGDEAVSVIRAGASIDLVFSDVRMPGSVDGLGLLEFVRAANPAIPVLITSGHSEPGPVLERGAAHFLRKPYEIKTLLHLVEDELGAPA